MESEVFVPGIDVTHAAGPGHRVQDAPPENYLDFARRLGRRTATTASSSWHAVASRVWEAFPFLGEVRPDPAEIDDLLVRRRFLALRYPVGLDTPGFDSVRFVRRGQSYGFNDLKQKSRNQTRRGLEAFSIREVSLGELAVPGWDAYRETLQRQGRHLPVSAQDNWLRYCCEAARTPGFQAWGAYGENGLAAFMVAFHTLGCCHVLLLRSKLSELPRYPNNALVFTVAGELLASSGAREVSFGWSSLRQDLASLSHFKIGMGFEAMPVRQRIILHPAIAWTAKIPTARQLFVRVGRLHSSEIGAKLEGMLAAVQASS